MTETVTSSSKCVTKTRRSNAKESKRPKQIEEEEDDKIFSLELWIENTFLGQVLAFLTFAFLVGLSILHLSMICQRLELSEYRGMSPFYGMEQLVNKYYGLDPLEAYSRAELRVNTSFFVH